MSAVGTKRTPLCSSMPASASPVQHNLCCGPSMAYIRAMLWRARSSPGRPKNAPAAFIQPCRPTEVVCVSKDGVPDFDALHSRTNDHVAVACAFDLLMLNGDDMRRKPFAERKAALGKLLFRSRDGIQYVEHAEGHGDNMFAAVCDLGLEGIVSKRLNAPYRSGPSKSWIKVKNPKAAAATRVPRWGVLKLNVRFWG